LDVPILNCVSVHTKPSLKSFICSKVVRASSASILSAAEKFYQLQNFSSGTDILVLNLVVHLGVFELGCAFARLAQNKKLNPERTPADLRGDLQPIFKQAFWANLANAQPSSKTPKCTTKFKNTQMHNQVQKHPNAQPSSKLKYQFHLRNFGADGPVRGVC
jgi:hypothetical protein